MVNSAMTGRENGHAATLLERALEMPKSTYRGRQVTPELVELAIAFVRGEVSSKQAGAVLGLERQSAVQRMWTAFRRAVVAGRISVSDMAPMPAPDYRANGDTR